MIVYTAITGQKDKLIEQPQFKGVRYVAYLEDPTQSDTWEERVVDYQEKDPVRRAKIYKVLSHKYVSGVSMWIDGNIKLLKDPKELVKKYLKGDMAVIQHGIRDCLFEEASECVKYNLDDKEIILDQIARYWLEEMPQHYGLYGCMVIIRKDNKKVREFNKLWWEEIQKGSRRDQISFPYCVRKSGIQLDVITDFNPHLENEWFERGGHAK